jgi:predicted RNA-binding Zn ribbon-like protein
LFAGVVTYYIGMTVSRETSPHNLDLVIDFVNTYEAERDTEELSSPAALADWLRQRELFGASTRPLRGTHLTQALRLREALRRVMAVHNGFDQNPLAAQELEDVASRGGLAFHFGEDGSPQVVVRDRGFAGALARLLVPVVEAAADGTWGRVKACRADDCLWAFYDRSRNRSGAWCEMAVCGNRQKVRAYRARQERS